MKEDKALNPTSSASVGGRNASLPVEKGRVFAKCNSEACGQPITLCITKAAKLESNPAQSGVGRLSANLSLQRAHVAPLTERMRFSHRSSCPAS